MKSSKAALLVTAAIALAACGGTADADPAADPTGDDVPATSPPADTSNEVPATEGPESEPDGDSTGDSTPDGEETAATTTVETTPVIELPMPADVDAMRSVGLPAMGGVTLRVPDGAVVHHAADMVLVRDRWELDEGRYLPSMVVALVSQSTQPGPVLTIDSMTTAAIGDVGSAEPNGELLRFGDRELEGWTFEMAEGKDIGPHYLYASYPRPTVRPDHWQPFPMATLYLADTPGGVLAVGYIGANADDLATARTLFETVAPTVEIDELRETVSVTGPAHPRPGGTAATSPVPDGWPAPLTAAFSPVDAGEYSTGQVGTPLRFEVDDRWHVQPNFPGWLVFTGIDSFGPLDRGVTLRTGLNYVVGLSTSSEPIGEPVERSLGEPWPLDALPTLVVSAQETVEIGGRTATVYDLSVDENADCSDAEPCAYAWLSSAPYPPEPIRKGYSMRVWEFVTDVQRSTAVIAAGGEPEWLDRAEELVGSFVFADE